MRVRILTVALVLAGAAALLLFQSASRTDSAATGEPPAEWVTIPQPGEPGEALRFWGRVLDMDGRPLSKAAVVAYHTDSTGLYNPRGGGTRVPRLRGVAVTDAEGRFGFVTIRPAAYPDRTQPAHIHLSVTAPAHHVRYLEYWFEGDPLITPGLRAQASRNPSTVIVDLQRDSGGGASFSHEIRLEGN